jgi:phage terminase Nu1 subunit (DNA packaging protein)
MDAVISKAQLSRQLGVSRAAVTSYVRRGMPVNFDGELNSAEALAWVNKHVEPHHAGRGAAMAAEAPEAERRGGDDRTVLAAERARLACAQADMQEMKNAALRGALLPRDEVTAAVQACFSRGRARLLAIPTRAAPQVVLLKTMPEVKALLTALIHEALQGARGGQGRGVAGALLAPSGGVDGPLDRPGVSRWSGDLVRVAPFDRALDHRAARGDPGVDRGPCDPEQRGEVRAVGYFSKRHSACSSEA